MTLHLSLDSLFSKLLTILLALAVFGVLVVGALWYVAVGTLTDDRIQIPREVLIAGIEYFPHSPRLQARVAAAEMQGIDRDLNKAEVHIRRAIELLPGEYSYQMILAAILESQGKRDSAEQAYRDALTLAPNYLEVHWRLANNLVRQGKVKESWEHFRYATGKNLALLPNAYDLIWAVSNNDIASLTAITSATPRAQLLLAEFLVKQGKFAEAAQAYRQIKREDKRTETETATVINALMTANQLPLAREFWGEVMGDENNKPQPLLWNGGFEDDVSNQFGQFDWSFKDNEFVRVMIDPQNAHTGARALRVTFLGKDTVRIDGEIKQLALVKPGKRYRLECQYKTRDLTTSLGPRIAVIEAVSKNIIVASEALPEGTHAWQAIGVEFTAPATASGVLIQVQRIPKYSYDDPSRGVIWFDDFVLKEL